MLRQQASLTPAQLARQLSSTGGKLISERRIQDWDEGEYQPELSIPQRSALCWPLGVIIDELANYLALHQQNDYGGDLTWLVNTSLPLFITYSSRTILD